MYCKGQSFESKNRISKMWLLLLHQFTMFNAGIYVLFIRKQSYGPTAGSSNQTPPTTPTKQQQSKY